jgi:8-oxo-dGTP pyrophosphatase MutT (NUDIX family)
MPHIHEKIDFTAEVFIVHKNKVLLRMHDKAKIWLSVGGHIELDEDPVQAVIREAKEEVGLDIKIIGDSSGPLSGMPENRGYTYLITPRHIGRHPVSEIHEHVVFVYYATCDSDVISESVNEHERSAVKWVMMDELKAMNLVPNVLFYATEALKELGKE